MTRGNTVRLDFHSTFDMLDFVQVVSDQSGGWPGSTTRRCTGSASPCASR